MALGVSGPFRGRRLDQLGLHRALAPSVEVLVGTVCADGTEPGELPEAQIERMQDLAKAAARILELRRSFEHVTQAVAKDPLTGLLNRGVFEETAGRAVDLSARGVSRPAVLCIDLDDFKPIDDRRRTCRVRLLAAPCG